MTSRIARRAVMGAFAAALSAGVALAQPTLNPQGGSGNVEMDHSRMGGQQQGQRPGGPAPTISPQGGSGNAEMDHSRMGGANMGGPHGGRVTGNPGSGPEVEHGPPRNTPPRR